MEGSTHARATTVVVLSLLAFVALVVRIAFDVDGALDTDTISFGLAAFHFDILQHQPHPPGYPGYVVYLKVIHLVARWLGPLEVAKWGSRIAGAASVPAAYWACRRLLWLGEPRALCSAGFVVVSPVLWYYGADGQAHAAEALLALVLLGAVAAARSGGPASLRRVLLVVAAFGLAGSIRPTIPTLLSPLLVWLLWGRPLRDWAAGALAGAISVAVWFVPLVLVTGGWDLYRRAGNEVHELFVATFSILGERVTVARAARNVSFAGYSAVLACVPLLAWVRARGQTAAGVRAWRSACLSAAALSTLFFAVVYTAESGYFAGVAALACLAPATWPAVPSLRPRLRAALVIAGAVAFVLAGPAEIQAIGAKARLPLPTLAHVAEVDRGLRLYRSVVCGAAGDEPTLVLTDNPVTTHSRWLPLACPDVVVGLHMEGSTIAPDLDVWLLFERWSLVSLPTRVPLEAGPPVRYQVRPVRRVVVVPDATDEFVERVARQASCRPMAGLAGQAGQPWPDGPMVWPARCLPELKLGAHTLVLAEPR